MTTPLPSPEFWRDRRVLLTGHTGFKGGWTALWLKRLGARVTGFALRPDADPSLFRLAEVGRDLNSRLGDLRDPEAVRGAVAAADPEIVLHYAAQPLVRRAIADPVEAIAVNALGVAHLLDALRAGKLSFSASKNLACKMLRVVAMSSMENIYKKMAESAASAGAAHEIAQKFDSARHIPPAVAHELNNVIAIIRGYADRLLFKHSQDPALEPHLKLISEAAKRAGTIVHDAMPPKSHPGSPPHPAATATTHRLTASFIPVVEISAIRFDALRSIA